MPTYLNSAIQVLNQSALSLPDGQLTPPIAGKQGQTLVDAIHGKYYNQSYRGNVFLGTSAAAGVTLPLPTATAQVFGLWNPQGSGKNASLLHLSVGYASGTAAPSNICLCYLTGCGATIATAAPITVFTAATPINALIGLGTPSVMKFTPSGATMSATALLRTLGMSQLTTTAATTTAPGFMWHFEFDGTLILPQGVYVGVCGNIATTTVATCTLAWEEVPA